MMSAREQYRQACRAVRKLNRVGHSAYSHHHYMIMTKDLNYHIIKAAIKTVGKGRS
jgi:hypothetical protein